MPLWRKLHVKTIESVDFNEMPDEFTRLLWVLFPLGLDKEGRGIDNSAWIRSKIFPLRLDITLEQIESSMDWLCTRGMIKRYQINGRRYFYIPTFRIYQRTDREAPSTIPEPMSEEVLTNSIPTPDKLATNSSTDTETDTETEKEIDIAEGEGENRYRGINIFAVYEHEIGPLTPAIAEALQQIEQEHPPPWIIAAMKISAINNKRSLAYTRAILKRWKAEGYGSEFNKPAKDKNSEPAGYAAIREYLKEQGLNANL